MRVVVATARARGGGAPCLPSRPLATTTRVVGRRRSLATTPTTHAEPRGGGGGQIHPLPLLGGGASDTSNNADDMAPPLLAPRSDSIAASTTAAAAAAETARLLMMPLPQVGGFDASAAAASAADTEGVLSELVHLPVDCTELLGLRGHPSYLLCDVTRAYDALLGRAPDGPGGEADERAGEGFSDAALAGRLEVLELAKDAAVMAEGRVGGRAAPRWLGAAYTAASDGGAGADDLALALQPPPPYCSFAVPVYLLPAALVLLCQVGRADLVADLAAQALQNWVIRAHHKRDLLLALALSFCGAARDLFDAGETLCGCAALEEALALLRNATGAAVGSVSPSGQQQQVTGGGALGVAFAAVSHSLSGSPPHGDAAAAAAAPTGADQLPLAPRLAVEIEQALQGLEAPRVLDELRLLPLGDPARRRSVSALRAMMQQQQQQQQQGASAATGRGGGGRAPSPSLGGKSSALPGAENLSTVTVDYARMAFGLMGSEEVCEAADWQGLASGVAAAVRSASGGGAGAAGKKAARRYLATAAPWLYPEALSTAAAAHLVAGFAAREPETVRLAAALAAAADVVVAASSSASSSSSSAPSSSPSSSYPSPVPPPATAESAVLRAVAAVLLGAVDDAVALLAAAQHLPSAGAWPSAEVQLAAAAASPADPVLTDPSTGAPLLLPAEPQACWRFVRAQATTAVSGDDDDASAHQHPQQQQQDASNNNTSASSNAEDDPLPGLCVFTELWLSRLGFAAFADTLERPPSPVLTGYFASPRVESLLERYAQEAAARAAASSSSSSSGPYSSTASSFARAGRGSAALAVAAAARVAEGVGRTVGRGLHAAQAAANAAASAAASASAPAPAPAPSALPPSLISDEADTMPPNNRARIPASLPPPPPPLPAPPRPSAAASSSAAFRRHAAAEAGGADAAGTLPSRPSSPSAAAAAAASSSSPATARFLASQQPRPRRTLAALADLVAGGAAALAAAAVAKAGSSKGTTTKARKLGAAAAVIGGAVLATAVVAARLSSSGAPSPLAASNSARQQRVAAVASAGGATTTTTTAKTAAAATTNPLSAALGRLASPSAQAGRPSPVRVRVVGGPEAGAVLELTPQHAEKLLRRWHEAKAAALGPRYDAAALGSCAAEPLLSAVAQRADRFEAEGWFLRLRALAPPRVTRLEAAGGAVLARAEVQEAAALFSGADGRRADGYSGAFSCEYRLVLCEDGQWRVAAVKSGDGDRDRGGQW